MWRLRRALLGGLRYRVMLVSASWLVGGGCGTNAPPELDHDQVITDLNLDCGTPHTCSPLDLTAPDLLHRGRYSDAGECNMDSLMLGRPGLLELRQRSDLWLVHTDVEGNAQVVHVHAATPNEVEVCEIDRTYLQRCRTPQPACLRPEIWVKRCQPRAPVCEVPPPQQDKPCVPTAGPSRWVEEEETLDASLSFTCADGDPLSPDAVRFDALPAGADYDAGSGRLLWTPELDQAATYELTFRIRATGEPGSLRVGVLDAFDHPGNKPIKDPERYTHELGLPVVFVEDPEHDEYRDTRFIYAGHRYAGVKVKTRGRSSLPYPTHSNTMKFPSSDRFNEPSRGGGLTHRKKIVLTTTFDDNAYVRQRLAHEMWAALDPEHVSVGAFSVVVYRDGEYRGLYNLTDHVDRHLMANRGLSDRGQLFKSYRHAGDFRTDAHGMEKQEGQPEQGEAGWDARLQALIRLVRDADAGTFAAQLSDHIDVRDYQHWWVFTVLFGTYDSAAKNAYHYVEPGGTFRLIPWDFNASFGQDWQTLRHTGRNDGLAMNGLWSRMADSPVLRAELLDRLRAAMAGPCSAEAVIERLDAVAAEVEPSAARDFRRWRDEHMSFERWAHRTDFTSPSEEVEYMRSWIEARWDYFEAAGEDLLPAPGPSRNDEGRDADDEGDQGGEGGMEAEEE